MRARVRVDLRCTVQTQAAFQGADNPDRMSQRRNNPFARAVSPSTAPSGAASASVAVAGRPKSSIFPPSSPRPAVATPPPHTRNQSSSSIPVSLTPVNGISNGTRPFRSDSKSSVPNSSTFAPSFIKTEDLRRSIDVVKGIEGENDFSGRRYVWLKDPQAAFVMGWVVEEADGGKIIVQCDDGSVCCSCPPPPPL